MSNEMTILTRAFDLLAWLVPRTEKFPKLYRQTVTARLLDAALDFQEALFDALSQSGTTRQRHLRAADAHLNKLRLYLRLAHQWRWLNDGQYHHVSEMVAEVGRLLGGWLKTQV
ncbi:MAG: diversity-generating retroelement protein Avd [Acidobacteria bacterium]|nr:diversity-generating retroelement protein Avd [Acidobacteriota bacterium]